MLLIANGRRIGQFKPDRESPTPAALMTLTRWIPARFMPAMMLAVARDVKSSGTENTYPADLIDRTTIRNEIHEMATHAVAWLARKQLLARTVPLLSRKACVRVANFLGRVVLFSPTPQESLRQKSQKCPAVPPVLVR